MGLLRSRAGITRNEGRRRPSLIAAGMEATEAVNVSDNEGRRRPSLIAAIRASNRTAEDR